METLISTLAIWALPVLLAITLHEAAHAAEAGRITLNPFRHIDPVGTILVPAGILGISILFGSSGMLFGWAKPVPVNFARLRNPKADMLWVAAAGPFMNLLMAFGWAAALKLVISAEPGTYTDALIHMSMAGITINAILMFLNLLPLPPLDGGRIAVSLLPDRLAWSYARIEPYGFPILLIALFSGILGAILWPMIAAFRGLISTIFSF
jgi:Zn-dependent protease